MKWSNFPFQKINFHVTVTIHVNLNMNPSLKTPFFELWWRCPAWRYWISADQMESDSSRECDRIQWNSLENRSSTLSCWISSCHDWTELRRPRRQIQTNFHHRSDDHSRKKAIRKVPRARMLRVSHLTELYNKTLYNLFFIFKGHSVINLTYTSILITCV